MTETTASASALTVRPPATDDLNAVFALVTAADVREFGEGDYGADEFAEIWRGLDLAVDARVVTLPEPDGRLVGWIKIENTGRFARLHADGYVHPDCEGIGVGSTLVRWAERRALELIERAPTGVRGVIQIACNARNERAMALFQMLDYAAVRRFWRMQIALDPDNPPLPPRWPDGFTLRSVADEADERRLYAVVDEAFRDHWGYISEQFETWIVEKKRFGFDPELWLIVRAGDEVVASAVGTDYPGMGGWINDVAVRRPWRRRGLAEALLREVFHRFAERGQANVSLGVDAANPTGATRLYEKAGMQVNRAFIFFEKELRPGLDLTAAEE